MAQSGYCINSATHTNWKSVLKMTLCYLAWIFLCLRVKIHCVGNTILAKLSSIMSRMWGRNCSHGCSHTQNHIAGMIWRDTVPSKGVGDKDHHGTTFSMPARTTLSPHHCCSLSAVIHSFIHSFIHSWKDTGIPHSSVCSLICFAMSNSVKWLSLSLFYHSDPIISTAEIIHEMQVDTLICKCVMHYTSPYCNITKSTATSTDTVQAGIWSYYRNASSIY